MKPKIIIDTNILFSILLSKENKYKHILFNTNLEFYTCNFLFVEIFKHKNKIQNISNLTEDEVLWQLETILNKITFIKEEFIPKEIFNKAYLLSKDIDEKDTPFVALSIFLNGLILTGDKKLKNHLKQKGFNNFYELE